MKILIVTHSYAPDETPRAFRWTTVAESWARQGARIDVITTGRRSGAIVEEQNGVTVHRVGERALGALRQRLGAQASSKPDRSMAAQRDSARGIAKLIYDATWKRIYWPDHAALWYFSAIRRARDLWRTKSYDAVVTVSHPFTGHLVGLALARNRPNLRWIVDVGDPFSVDKTEPFNNSRLYRRLNRHIERRVYERGDAISVTVEGCRTTLAALFPAVAHKITVIPPLLSVKLATAANEPVRTASGVIDMAYLGVLYASIRRPDVLLMLFAAMHRRNANLRLHFYGDLHDCAEIFDRVRAIVGSAIVIHGSVPHSRVPSIMAASDILVNIGNDTAFQLPSKLVEYASAARPILNIVRSADDTATAFLRDYPAALTIVCADGTPTEAQVSLALNFATHPPAVEPSVADRFVSRFYPHRIAQDYARLVRAENDTDRPKAGTT